MDNLDVNRLWQNYVDTITNHYVDFTGRVGRPQFWYFMLADIVIAIGVTIVGSIIGLRSLSDLYSLALLLPTLGLTVRRRRLRALGLGAGLEDRLRSAGRGLPSRARGPCCAGSCRPRIAAGR